MAFLLSAVLTCGTFLSILWFSVQLPALLDRWKGNLLKSAEPRSMNLTHIAQVLWVLYALQVWNTDFAVPNLIQSILSFGYLSLFYVLQETFQRFATRYFLVCPVALLLFWKVLPSALTGVSAASLELAATVSFAEDRKRKRTAKEKSENDGIMMELKTGLCGAWVAFGALKSDLIIVTAFTLDLILHGVEWYLTAKAAEPSGEQGFQRKVD